MAIPLQTRLNALAPDLARGARAAVATLVPFYFASRLGRGELAWMALGGWLGTLADPNGSRLTRARTLFAFALAGATTVTVSEAAANDPWLAPLVLAAVAFGASLLRALGATTATFGTLLAIIAAVGTTHHGRATVRDGALFTLGAGLALVLTSVVWPVWRHLPLRRAMAAVWRVMAEYATELAACTRAGVPEGDARWNELHRQHRRYREAVEAARAAMVAERARRAGESRVGGNLRVLAGLADGQWPLLVTLSQELESLPADGRPKHAADELESIAGAWRSVERVLLTPVLRASPAIPREAPERRSAGPSVPAYDALLARLEHESSVALMRVEALDAPLHPEERAQERPGALRGWLDALGDDLQTLRDAMTPRSTFFRHAIRVASAALVASVVGARLSEHPQWVTITTIAVLQPYAGATVSRAAERVIGTVLGSLVAIAITMTFHSGLALTLVMFPLSVAAVATQPRSYRLFTFFLTPVFVLLSERYQGDWWTATARAADAVVGGLIALVAAVLVFPSREIRRLPDITARTLEAVVAYADTVLTALDRGGDAGTSTRIAEARRGAGVALGELETSLERLLAEPLSRDQESGADVLRLLTYAPRTTSAITALDTLASATPAKRSLPTGAAGAVKAYVDASFAAAESFVRAGAAASTTPFLDSSGGSPELPADLGVTLRAAFGRVLRYAALVGDVARPAE